MTIGQRIKALREQKGFSQIELAEKIGVSKQNLYKYENGIISNIPSDKIEATAAALETSPAYLMGWDDSTVSPLPLENIYMRPLYDSVAAGFNALAQNTIVGYIPTQIASPSEQEKYIWVNVVGDSMSPMIDDGSKVLIKLQDSVDSGQAAAVARRAAQENHRAKQRRGTDAQRSFCERAGEERSAPQFRRSHHL